jgi:hypothetical protein
LMNKFLDTDETTTLTTAYPPGKVVWI